MRRSLGSKLLIMGTSVLVGSAFLGFRWGFPSISIRHLESIQWQSPKLAAYTTVLVNKPIYWSTSFSSPLPALWQTTYPVSSTVLSRAMGFSVQQPYHLGLSRTGIQTHPNTPHGWWATAGYPLYVGYRFQIWETPLFGTAHMVGHGWAGKPIAIAFFSGPIRQPGALPNMPPIPHVTRFQKPEKPQWIHALISDPPMKFIGLFQTPYSSSPH